MDERFMRLALAQAERALAEGEVPVGCVVARGDNVIAVGRNRREAVHDPTAHAEVLALREAAGRLGARRLQDCTLYVTLEPCPMCAGAVSLSRLRRLVFGAFDREQGCAHSVYRVPEDPAFSWFTPVTGGVLERECAALLKRFFAARR